MNKRIKQLIKQSTTIEHGVDNGFDRVTFNKEKFAELIVKECINSVIANGNSQSTEDYDRGYIDGQSFSLKCIKKHFGVEE